jgi:hypothetical protein
VQVAGPQPVLRFDDKEPNVQPIARKLSGSLVAIVSDNVLYSWNRLA